MRVIHIVLVLFKVFLQGMPGLGWGWSSPLFPTSMIFVHLWSMLRGWFVVIYCYTYYPGSKILERLLPPLSNRSLLIHDTFWQQQDHEILSLGEPELNSNFRFELFVTFFFWAVSFFSWVFSLRRVITELAHGTVMMVEAHRYALSLVQCLERKVINFILNLEGVSSCLDLNHLPIPLHHFPSRPHFQTTTYFPSILFL